MGKTRSAKSMVYTREYRSRTVKAGRGKGSYRRWAHDQPSQNEVRDYIDMMNELAKGDDNDIIESHPS